MSGIDITSDLNADLINRQVANNITGDYRYFLSKINSNLLRCFEGMEEDANTYQKDGEVELSRSIRQFLRGAFIPCTTETNSNGHVDLTISQGKFTWLGEAKIQGGEKWSYHGYRQLTENYSTGRKHAKYGGMIIYNKLKSKSSKACANDFKEYLSEKHSDLEFQDFTDDCYFDMTLPEHPRSGNPYHVRAYYVNLHYTESEVFDKEIKS